MGSKESMQSLESLLFVRACHIIPCRAYHTCWHSAEEWCWGFQLILNPVGSTIISTATILLKFVDSHGPHDRNKGPDVHCWASMIDPCWISVRELDLGSDLRDLLALGQKIYAIPRIIKPFSKWNAGTVRMIRPEIIPWSTSIHWNAPHFEAYHKTIENRERLSNPTPNHISSAIRIRRLTWAQWQQQGTWCILLGFDDWPMLDINEQLLLESIYCSQLFLSVSIRRMQSAYECVWATEVRCLVQQALSLQSKALRVQTQTTETILPDIQNE